eukprot:10425483-Heterocapsa_arctica.AAC.1
MQRSIVSYARFYAAVYAGFTRMKRSNVSYARFYAADYAGSTLADNIVTAERQFKTIRLPNTKYVSHTVVGERPYGRVPTNVC